MIARKLLPTLLVAAALMGALVQLRPTQAAWTDAAAFTANVSTSNWGTPPDEEGPPYNQGGIDSGNEDTDVGDVDWSYASTTSFCAAIAVTTDSPTPVNWELTVDVTAAPFYGSTAVQANGTANVVVVNSTTLEVTGVTGNGAFNPQSNNTPINNTQTASVTLCMYNAPPAGPADPSWYDVTITQGTWTNNQACLVVTINSTITDLNAHPFYFGWVVPLDITSAKNRITSTGRQARRISWSPHPGGGTNSFTDPTSYTAPLPDVYTVTNGKNTALKALGGGADSTTFTACVHEY